MLYEVDKMERTILTATDGMILTDGKIFGRTIYLAKDVLPSAFKEITEEEYNKMSAQEHETI